MDLRSFLSKVHLFTSDQLVPAVSKPRDDRNLRVFSTRDNLIAGKGKQNEYGNKSLKTKARQKNL